MDLLFIDPSADFPLCSPLVSPAGNTKLPYSYVLVPYGRLEAAIMRTVFELPIKESYNW